jgi:uncharacterized protein (DUF2235 family)
VVKIAQVVAKREDQLVFYHEGVGVRPHERVIGGAFGLGLSRNVRSAYRFLVEHHEPGDELFLLRLQPWRLHRAQHSRFHPELRDPAA